MLGLRSLAVAGAVATASLLCSALASAPAGAATPGQPVQPAQARPDSSAGPSLGGTNHALNGDSCPTARSCMAVGDYNLGNGHRGLSELLTGGTWVVKPVPSPAHGQNIFANEVSCSAVARCLFVGAHWAGRSGADTNLAQAWNGSSWRIVTATGPAGSSFSNLNDVACPILSFCLAVGNAGRTTREFQDTAYTWRNGTTWRAVSVPHPRDARSSELAGLSCSSRAYCLAVGDYTSAAGRYLPFADRWDNGRWRLLTVPAIAGQRQTVLQGVSCPTTAKC